MTIQTGCRKDKRKIIEMFFVCLFGFFFFQLGAESRGASLEHPPWMTVPYYTMNGLFKPEIGHVSMPCVPLFLPGPSAVAVY